jgi:peptidyl-prolyl cis-trans isomerase D
MATLEKIRSKAGILIAVVIGLALLAFILGDLFDSRKSIFTASKMTVAEVNGNSIKIQEFESKIEELTQIVKINSGKTSLDEQTTEGIREQAWNNMLNQEIFGREYDKIGLAVCSDELYDEIQGSNPHQIVRQIFTNPQTGEFNKPALLNFLKSTNDPQPSDQRTFRLFLENEVQKDRINTKYFTLVRKGMSFPTFMAKNAFEEMNKKADISFVQLPYASVSDDASKVDDSELKAYYKAHKYLYNQETASRDLEYVMFNVDPSREDFTAAQDWINKIKPDFVASTEVEQFVNSNSEVPYEDKNYNPEGLQDSLGIFMNKANVGDVYGPYFVDGEFKLARMYKIINVPDSVKARHILLAARSQEEVARVKALADSIKKVVEKGADFAALAAKYSEDKGSAIKGGDLGWFAEGQMVPTFNDAAFSAKAGDVKIVESQYGLHVLQVTERGKEKKKFKIAFIRRKVEPSSQTFQQVYAAAMKLASENRTLDKLKAAAAKQNLAIRQAQGIGQNDKAFAGITQARPVVKWAFSAKKGEVSEPIDLTGKYIVAGVVAARDKGISPLEDVKADVEARARREKKAKILTDKINTALTGCNSILDLGNKLKASVQAAPEVTFTSYALPYAGNEPTLCAVAPELPVQKLSKPIKGENGVYVVFVNRIDKPVGNNYSDAKMRLNYFLNSSVQYSVFGALQKLAGVEDNRSNFY